MVAATPSAANSFLKTMSVLMEFTLEPGLIDHNPVRDVKKIKTNSNGFHTWTVAEVAAYEARHPVGTMARLAMDLMLYTGLRRSDVVRVGPQHIAGDVLSIQPVKTQRSSGVIVTVRILPALADSIAKTATGEKTLLISGWNRSFAVKGFGNWFRDRCNEAGGPDRHTAFAKRQQPGVPRTAPPRASLWPCSAGRRYKKQNGIQGQPKENS